MTNEFRDLDDLIGLSTVADVAPPLLGRQRPGAAPRATAASPSAPRPRRTPPPDPSDAGTPLSSLITAPAAPPAPTARTSVRRPTAARRASPAPRPAAPLRPTAATRTTVTPPRVGRSGPGTQRVGNGPPLLSAVSTGSRARREAEPLSIVVTLIAWLLVALAGANAWMLFRTHGVLAERLPFSGYVEYAPVVLSVITWGDHVLLPAWLSALSVLGLSAAAVGTAGLRRIGSTSGPVLFGAALAGLLGIAGTLVGLAIVALATAIGVAIVLVIGTLIAIAAFMVIGALLEG